MQWGLKKLNVWYGCCQILLLWNCWNLILTNSFRDLVFSHKSQWEQLLYSYTNSCPTKMASEQINQTEWTSGLLNELKFLNKSVDGMIQWLITDTSCHLMVTCYVQTYTAQTDSLSVNECYDRKSNFWQYQKKKKKSFVEIGLWFGSHCVWSRPTAAQSKEFSERPW